MGVKVSNNAVATLDVAISNVDTTIQVGPQGAFFPALSVGDYFYGTLCNDPIATTQLPEIVKVTAVTPDGGTGYDLTVVRLGSVDPGVGTPVPWNVGSDIELRVTKQLLEDLVTGGVSQFPGLLGSSLALTGSDTLDNDNSGQFVTADSTLGGFTITLEDIPVTFERDIRFWVVKTSSDSNNVVIAADATDNIDGSASITLTKENEVAILHATPGASSWSLVRFDSYTEAPTGGATYGRSAAAWAAVTEEAPSDGTDYVRRDGSWEAANYASGASAVPAGVLAPYAGATAPSGWLMATGVAVSRTTYADLFTAIGTTFGSGDGSTTFNLPDLRGRAPFGDDTMGLSVAGRLTSANSRGLTGGAETHTLTSGEMPSHTHTAVSNGNHSHTYVDAKANKSGSAVNDGGSVDGVSTSTDNKVTGTAGSHTHTINSTGGGGAHNNMPPYQVFNYIIKT